MTTAMLTFILNDTRTVATPEFHAAALAYTCHSFVGSLVTGQRGQGLPSGI